MEHDRKKVFISYSWDNEEHQNWVLKLADKLTTDYGIVVLLDRYDLQAGKSLTHFMENSIITSDKVLVILTKEYINRMQSPRGGVGYESSIISQELYRQQTKNNKIIPVLREGEYDNITGYIGGLLAIDMRDDSILDYKLEEIARLTYGVSEITRPELGPIPDFKAASKSDGLLNTFLQVEGELKKNDAKRMFIRSQEGVDRFKSYADELFDDIRKEIDVYRTAYNSFPIQYEQKNISELFLWAKGVEFGIYLNRIQCYRNSLDGAILGILYSRSSKVTDKSLIRRVEYTFDVDDELNPRWEGVESVKQNDKIKSECLTNLMGAYCKKQRSEFI